MDSIKVRKLNPTRLAFIFFGWTLYGVFFASQNYLRASYFDQNADWQDTLSVWLTCAYSWAALTPPIVFAARRFRFSRADWLRSLLVHVPLSVVFSLTVLAVYTGLRFILARHAVDYPKLVVSEIHASVIIYFVILGITYGLDFISGRNAARRAELIPAEAADLLSETSETIDPELPSAIYADRIAVKENGRIVLVSVKEIDCITSEGNYVKLYANGRSRLMRETMKAMEQRLDPNAFVRVRRSAIVRIDRIKELHPLFNGEFEIVLANGTKITASRRYRKNLDALLKV